MKEVFSDYFNQVISLIFSGLSEEELDAKYNEILLSSLDSHSETPLETEVDINLIMSDNGWLITLDDNLIDAITGGMLTVANNLNNMDME